MDGSDEQDRPIDDEKSPNSRDWRVQLLKMCDLYYHYQNNITATIVHCAIRADSSAFSIRAH